MSDRRPYFSVITPSFNQGEWIEGCIQSVLAQGSDDFEHIVFDNCSTDRTHEILARYPYIQWHSEPDRGQSHAINKALALARGEIICWLNADDQYLPGVFARARKEFADPEIHVIFGDAQEVFFDGRPAGVRPARFAERNDILIWWEKRVDILQPAVLFRRSVVQRVGSLREDLHVIMDTEFWWRVSEHYRFHYLGIPLAIQQRQLDSKTIKHAHRIYEEKARVFLPILNRLQPQRRLRHGLARRRGMGRRYLGLAQSAARVDHSLARELLTRSLSENPLLVLTPQWWRARLFLRHEQASTRDGQARVPQS